MREMKVDRGLFQIMMSEEQLNGAQIGPSFQEVGCKTVTKHVRMDVFSLEAGAEGSVTAGMVNNLGSNWVLRSMAASTGEQPLRGFAS